jgi:hypothetical protein
LGSLIIFQQNLKHKSCSVKKIVPKSFSNYFLTPGGSDRQEKLNIKNLPIKYVVIAVTPDNNKVHFLTNLTSLLIPQRKNSFNKDKKVNLVKWYYSGLSFRDMQATFPVFYPERPIMSNIIHCHLWLSPRLRFPAIAILTNPLILFSIIVYFLKMLKNRTNKNWEPFLKL